MDIPSWLQVLLWVSAALTAVYVIGAKLVRPLWRWARRIEDAVPLMTELTAQLKDTSGPGSVLKELIAQFRSDSGSTAKDQLNRLEAATNLAAANAEVVRVAAATTKLLDERDREQLSRLIREQDRISDKVDAAIQMVMDLVADRAAVAATLVAREGAVDAHLVARETQVDRTVAAVADDLAATQHRAAAVTDAPAGAAADAAALPPDPTAAADAAATEDWVAGIHDDRRRVDLGPGDGPERRQR
jgi:hypothetical protein